MRTLTAATVAALLTLSCGGAIRGGTLSSGRAQVTYAEISDTVRGQLTPTCQDIWLHELGRDIDAAALQVCITQLANGATPDDIRERVRQLKGKP